MYKGWKPDERTVYEKLQKLEGRLERLFDGKEVLKNFYNELNSKEEDKLHIIDTGDYYMKKIYLEIKDNTLVIEESRGIFIITFDFDNDSIRTEIYENGYLIYNKDGLNYDKYYEIDVTVSPLSRTAILGFADNRRNDTCDVLDYLCKYFNI